MAVRGDHVHRGIRTRKHQVDWEQHDWHEMADQVRERLAQELSRSGIVYLNPRFTVTALPGAARSDFVRQARRAQVLWNMEIKRVLGGRARRRAPRELEPVERQLVFTGMLLLDGRHVHPDQWPASGR